MESLDRSFENVCELDLIFHFDEVNHVLSEIIQGGLVLETNINEISSCGMSCISLHDWLLSQLSSWPRCAWRERATLIMQSKHQPGTERPPNHPPIHSAPLFSPYQAQAEADRALVEEEEASAGVGLRMGRGGGWPV